MIRDSTRRRIDRKFAKTEPDLQGFLPTDGVTFAVSLVKDDSEDLLDLKVPDDPLTRAPGTDPPDPDPNRERW